MDTQRMAGASWGTWGSAAAASPVSGVPGHDQHRQSQMWAVALHSQLFMAAFLAATFFPPKCDTPEACPQGYLVPGGGQRNRKAETETESECPASSSQRRPGNAGSLALPGQAQARSKESRTSHPQGPWDALSTSPMCFGTQSRFKKKIQKR